MLSSEIILTVYLKLFEISHDLCYFIIFIINIEFKKAGKASNRQLYTGTNH